MIKNMGMENQRIQREIHIREIGKMIKKTEKEFLLGKMGVNTKDRGRIIKKMVKEYIFMVKGVSMKEVGLMIKKVAMELTSILIILTMTGNGYWIVNTEKGIFYLRIKMPTKEIGMME